MRFIPTSAGNIVLSATTVNIPSVHPHECGEHRSALTDAVDDGGSSPRVRGTCAWQFRWRDQHRFIPTSAGNMLSEILACAVDTVHPHECGEHRRDHDMNSIVGGSSPRVRGTYRRSPRQVGAARFIPTSAGNIAERGSVPETETVHPHECGEHLIMPHPHFVRSGSSPRVRGTFVISQGVETLERFIPTSAGNIQLIVGKHRYPAVHPHECGEH